MGVYITDAGRSNSTCKGPGVQLWVIYTMSWVQPTSHEYNYGNVGKLKNRKVNVAGGREP